MTKEKTPLHLQHATQLTRMKMDKHPNPERDMKNGKTLLKPLRKKLWEERNQQEKMT